MNASAWTLLNSGGKHSDWSACQWLGPGVTWSKTLGRVVTDIEVLNLWGYCNYSIVVLRTFRLMGAIPDVFESSDTKM